MTRMARSWRHRGRFRRESGPKSNLWELRNLGNEDCSPVVCSAPFIKRIHAIRPTSLFRFAPPSTNRSPRRFVLCFYEVSCRERTKAERPSAQSFLTSFYRGCRGYFFVIPSILYSRASEFGNNRNFHERSTRIVRDVLRMDGLGGGNSIFTSRSIIVSSRTLPVSKKLHF